MKTTFQERIKLHQHWMKGCSRRAQLTSLHESERSAWFGRVIAQELENPYGDDTNDLPLREMQLDMNLSLMRLLHPCAQTPPKFDYKRNFAEHRRQVHQCAKISS
eukprot:3322627-Amphidinium_carterae.1